MAYLNLLGNKVTDWTPAHGFLLGIQEEPTGSNVRRGLRVHSTAGINYWVNSWRIFCLVIDGCPLIYPGKKRQPAWWIAELQRLRCCIRRLLYNVKRSDKDVDWFANIPSFNDYKKNYIKHSNITFWMSLTWVIYSRGRKVSHFHKWVEVR